MAVIWKRTNDTGKNWHHVYQVAASLYVIWLLKTVAKTKIYSATFEMFGASTLPTSCLCGLCKEGKDKKLMVNGSVRMLTKVLYIIT